MVASGGCFAAQGRRLRSSGRARCERGQRVARGRACGRVRRGWGWVRVPLCDMRRDGRPRAGKRRQCSRASSVVRSSRVQRLVLDGAARWWAWRAVQGVRAASAVCEAWASSRVRSVAHRTAAVEVVMSTRVSGSRRACAYGTVARRGESRQVPEGKEGGGREAASEACVGEAWTSARFGFCGFCA